MSSILGDYVNCSFWAVWCWRHLRKGYDRLPAGARDSQWRGVRPGDPCCESTRINDDWTHKTYWSIFCWLYIVNHWAISSRDSIAQWFTLYSQQRRNFWRIVQPVEAGWSRQKCGNGYYDKIMLVCFNSIQPSLHGPLLALWHLKVFKSKDAP